MTPEQERILLAEARGWRNCEPEALVNVNGVPTMCPAGEPPPFDQAPYIAPLPDPRNAAADCERVMEWLQDIGWIVDEHHQAKHEDCPIPATHVDCWHPDSEIHYRADHQDRKHARCTVAAQVALALKQQQGDGE